MSKPRLTLIAAVAGNGVIGKNNALPWHLPEDLKHFKAVTYGHPIVMGRKTWESLGRPLPGRQNIVVTRNLAYVAAGATVVGSIADGLNAANAAGSGGNCEEVFLIGGAELYAQALPLADCLCLTEIALAPDGDAHFPAVDRSLWRETSRETHVGANGVEYAFVRYERRAA